MLERVLEPEVMDAPADAADYDAMDHTQVNRSFVSDFLTALAAASSGGAPNDDELLDLGTGTAQIPIALCQADPRLRVRGVDLAASMLELAARNVQAAGLTGRIRLQLADAKHLPLAEGRFAAIMSNSIVHHIPRPAELLAEICRVTAVGGLIFVRDLVRPNNEAELEHLVTTHAGAASPHQRQLFADSLRAALSLPEMQALVAGCGFAPSGVRLSSDRHWTWQAIHAG